MVGRSPPASRKSLTRSALRPSSRNPVVFRPLTRGSEGGGGRDAWRHSRFGFQTYLRLGEGDSELMEADAARHLDGLIVVVRKIRSTLQPDLALWGNSDK